MGFKIRDKSLFWTRAGWKNNWAPKVLMASVAHDPLLTQAIVNRADHHSFLRSTNSIIQWYRPTETIQGL